MSRADERENEFLLKLLEKHHARLKAQFDRHIVSIHDVLLPPWWFADGIFIVTERANQHRRKHEAH